MNENQFGNGIRLISNTIIVGAALDLEHIHPLPASDDQWTLTGFDTIVLMDTEIIYPGGQMSLPSRLTHYPGLKWIEQFHWPTDAL